MNARPLIVMMLGIVVVFVWMGYQTNSNVGESIEKSYKEFDEATNILSPLSDTYGLQVLNNQVKVAHDRISMEDFCKSIKHTSDKQKEYLKLYAELVRGKETSDDKSLFVVANEVFIYTEKLSTLCKNKDKDGIHKLIYNGELFVLVDSATKVIDRILDNKFNATAKFKEDAREAIKRYNQVLTFAGSLAMILGVLACRSKDTRNTRTKKSRIRRK